MYSRPIQNYFLERCPSLTPPLLFTPVATGIPGQAGTTSYTDTNAAGPGPRFYRVGVPESLVGGVRGMG